ncbi:MarR family winged helix-turn-helix transcriptional regulator [Bradyrhizobium roseum]|uniref:MarR family winged helix-turn-helix transcriptional regulator n=1 Tax=Bradyrhizobium roseum TaxID=3056648 RepID=UPI0026304037|nr:MarR family transcriptional regulator [Bradyrhizobium roseus]WKA26412.1 MarR family transcriptional regulator [Bradyrhizobium roseus]
MKQPFRKRSDVLGTDRRDGSGEIDSNGDDLARRFSWEIAAIAVHLQEIHNLWAKAVGVTGPQWLIIAALAELDQGQGGVPVNIVAKMLHVDPSFVTTQSKMLEKRGFLRRKPSSEDARVVKMSLTDKTYKQIAGLHTQQRELYGFIFGELNYRELSDLTDKLTVLRNRCIKAVLKVEIER